MRIKKNTVFLLSFMFMFVFTNSVAFAAAGDRDDPNMQARAVQEHRNWLQTQKKDYLHVIKKSSSDVIPGGIDIRPALKLLKSVEACINELQKLIGSQSSDVFWEKDRACRDMADALVEGDEEEGGPLRKLMEPKIACANTKRILLKSLPLSLQRAQKSIQKLARMKMNVSQMKTLRTKAEKLVKVWQKKSGKCKGIVGEVLPSNDDLQKINNAFNTFQQEETHVCDVLFDSGVPLPNGFQC